MVQIRKCNLLFLFLNCKTIAEVIQDGPIQIIGVNGNNREKRFNLLQQ